MAEIKYRIVAEYKYTAPYVSGVLYDTREIAYDKVNISLIEATKRVWVQPVVVEDDGYISNAMHLEDDLVAENGFGKGPLAPV